MKIRIVTFINENNSGAVLQAFALSKYLEQLGNAVEVVDYDPHSKKRTKKLGLNLRKLVLCIHHYIVTNKFDQFRKKYIKLTAKVNSVRELERMDDCDLYIAGSDQIWNPHLTEGMDDIFFLNFKTNARKISYAASYGREDFSDPYISDVIKLTSDYEYISVREEDFRTELSRKTSRKIQCVPDPVFLLDVCEYRSIEKKQRLPKYLLIYTKSHTDDIWDYAEYIAKKLELKIVDTSKFIKKKGVDYNKSRIAPEDFLGLIDGAEVVLTNSFHGTAFSILLHKNFYTLSAGAANTRIAFLLETLGLSNRQLSDMDFEIETIDYNVADEIIVGLRETAVKFINKGLYG